MKITLIKYSKEFPSQLGNRWIGIEASLDPDDDPDDAHKTLVSTVNDWGNREIPLSVDTGFGPQPVTYSGSKVINRAHERLKDLMADCTTLEELYKYYDDVKASNDPDVLKVYDQMGIKLFKK